MGTWHPTVWVGRAGPRCHQLHGALCRDRYGVGITSHCCHTRLRMNPHSLSLLLLPGSASSIEEDRSGWLRSKAVGLVGTVSPAWVALGFVSLCAGTLHGVRGHPHTWVCFAGSQVFAVFPSVSSGPRRKAFPDYMIFHLQINLLLPDLLPSAQEHL